jgi:hypothetical protein
VFDTPICSKLPAALTDPTQNSDPNSGTLIQRTLNAFTLANPSAITGNVPQFTDRDNGFKSAHAGAIFGNPNLNAGTLGLLFLSPPPNVRLPFEFQKNPFHTQGEHPR